jgi:hypothetical protein
MPRLNVQKETPIMMKLFGFGKDKATRPSTSPRPEISGEPMTGATLQHTDVQRELVRVVLKDTLRKNGIPAGWIGCEVTGISHRNMDDELFVHLIVMNGNEALLQYAPALQQDLMQGLDRFEPNVDHSNYVVSWLFSPDAGFKRTSLPAPNFWVLNEAAQQAAMSPENSELKFDLPEPSTPIARGTFAPTVPTSLS